MIETGVGVEPKSERKEPIKVKLGEWFFPFQKPKDLPSFRNGGIKMPFSLENYGPGEIVVNHDQDFNMDTPPSTNQKLMVAADKPITLIIENRVSGSSAKDFWSLTGERGPMTLAIILSDIPKNLVYEELDRHKRPLSTTGLKCTIEIPLAIGKGQFYDRPNVMGGHYGDFEKQVQYFGGLWQSKEFSMFRFHIYFADDAPEVFKGVRIKFEKIKPKPKAKKQALAA